MALFRSKNEIHDLRKPKKKFISKLMMLLILLTGLTLVTGVIVYMMTRNEDESASFLPDDYYRNFETSAELEGRFAARGSFETASSVLPSGNDAIGDIYVHYPAGAEKGGEKLPLIIVVNPSETPAKSYRAFLDRLASWGFIVAGNDDSASGDGSSTSATLDSLLESSFKDIIDTESIGVAGYSLGGAGALAAATMYDNGGTYKAIYTASAPYMKLAEENGWNYDPSKIGAPYFMAASTGKNDDQGVRDINQDYGGISPLKGLVEVYNAMPEGVPRLRGRVADADHADMLVKSDGYMTAWMLYWLKGDEEAKKAFFGEDAEILSNANWQDVKRILPDAAGGL